MLSKKPIGLRPIGKEGLRRSPFHSDNAVKIELRGQSGLRILTVIGVGITNSTVRTNNGTTEVYLEVNSKNSPNENIGHKGI